MIAPPSRPARFLFDVRRSEVDYSFSIQPDASAIDPYWETLTLRCDATCLAPGVFAGRGAKLVFLGERELDGLPHERRQRFKPKCVGFLEASKQKLELLGSLPFASIWALSVAIAGGAVRYLEVEGEPLYRGRSDLTGLAFTGRYLAEDWPAPAGGHMNQDVT